MNRRLLALAGASLLTLAVLPNAPAQNQPVPADLVAHINAIKGKVSVRHGAGGEWIAAVNDQPLAADDFIATGPNGYAEIRLDLANLLQIGNNAELSMPQLEDQHYRIVLAKGGVTYQVVGPSTAAVAVETPVVSVAPAWEGVYRINVKPSQSEIAPQVGDVEVFAPSGGQWVSAGQKMLVRGTAGNPEFRILTASRFWKRLGRLAGIFQNIQIGGGGSSDSSSDDNSSSKKQPSTTAAAATNKVDRDASKAAEGRPHTPGPVKAGPQVQPASHSGGDTQAFTPAHTESNSHANTAAHADGGSHASPAAASHTDTSSHASAAPASHTDSSSHASAAASHTDSSSHTDTSSHSSSSGGSHK